MTSHLGIHRFLLGMFDLRSGASSCFKVQAPAIGHLWKGKADIRPVVLPTCSRDKQTVYLPGFLLAKIEIYRVQNLRSTSKSFKSTEELEPIFPRPEL
jgi:hypothetical protein